MERPATGLIGNLLAKPPPGEGGIFLSRDRKMPARNEKSTLLRIPGNEGDMWSGWVVKGSTADRARGLEDRGEKRWGQNLKWHFFLPLWECPSWIAISM